MASDERRMTDGERRMTDGERRATDGERRMTVGERRMNPIARDRARVSPHPFDLSRRAITH